MEVILKHMRINPWKNTFQVGLGQQFLDEKKTVVLHPYRHLWYLIINPSGWVLQDVYRVLFAKETVKFVGLRHRYRDSPWIYTRLLEPVLAKLTDWFHTLVIYFVDVLIQGDIWKLFELRLEKLYFTRIVV